MLILSRLLPFAFCFLLLQTRIESLPGRYKPEPFILSLFWLLPAPLPGCASSNLSCCAFSLLLQAQTALFDPFVAVAIASSLLLQAQTAHTEPLPGCYKPKLVMLILSLMLKSLNYPF
jgi:hypothetical protein